MQKVSDADGRTSDKTTTVLGEQDFYELDAKVNTYPMRRTFKAIGTADGDLAEDMRLVVEGVVGGSVDYGRVSTRPSRNGNYVSVSVGPVTVHDREQVVSICTNMQNDHRVRWVI